MLLRVISYPYNFLKVFDHSKYYVTNSFSGHCFFKWPLCKDLVSRLSAIQSRWAKVGTKLTQFFPTLQNWRFSANMCWKNENCNIWWKMRIATFGKNATCKLQKDLSRFGLNRIQELRTRKEILFKTFIHYFRLIYSSCCVFQH